MSPEGLLKTTRQLQLRSGTFCRNFRYCVAQQNIIDIVENARHHSL